MNAHGLTPRLPIGDGLGRAARIGAKNPRPALKAPITVEDVLNSRMNRLPVPAAAVLPGDRWRRRANPGRRRARPRLPAKAGLPTWRRRECRDADGE
jgi:hypothetical protein